VDTTAEGSPWPPNLSSALMEIRIKFAVSPTHNSGDFHRNVFVNAHNLLISFSMGTGAAAGRSL